MSRSRKKHPHCSSYHRGKNGTRHSKMLASKAVRRFNDEIPNGRWFKKIYPSYNIFDQKSYWNDERGYRK